MPLFRQLWPVAVVEAMNTASFPDEAWKAHLQNQVFIRLSEISPTASREFKDFSRPSIRDTAQAWDRAEPRGVDGFACVVQNAFTDVDLLNQTKDNSRRDFWASESADVLIAVKLVRIRRKPGN